MQTHLEQSAIEARQKLSVGNDYTVIDEYNDLHPDALSSGNALGKGTGGGHTHSVPWTTKDKSISRANFNTSNGGGLYDIEGRHGVGGRNFLQAISNYNSQNEYGPNSIDTTANEGQIRL